ncbi:MAG: hypothetical protein HZB29_11835 [Nitrospinae bacterium]|nr:hypothetical protein [Nitrospinota bacterium]
MNGDNTDLFERALVRNLMERLGPPAKVTLTDNRRSLISARRVNGELDLRVSRSFALANEAVIEALVRFVTGKARRLPACVKEYMDRRQSPKHVVKKALIGLKSKGICHDLAIVAGRVDSKYFSGSLNCRIAWGEPPSRLARRARSGSIKLGSYDRDLDLIRIHPALDSDMVPGYFIEMVVYHELLHKKLGSGIGPGGRRTPHHPEFRRMEKLFGEYDAAMEWEKNNISKLLRARQRMVK